PHPHESIEQVLARFGGNREAAARHLGISRTTLWRRMKAD
ncbi:MAG: helix-turn-helix domain-containing protein, partial [Burkholderiaceae bacterium]